MISIKVKFRPSCVIAKEGSIYYQLILNRVVKRIKTNYKLFPQEWDDLSSEIVPPLVGDKRNNYLLLLKEKIRLDINWLNKIAISLGEKEKLYTTSDVVAVFQTSPKESSLFDFMQDVIIKLQQLGKIRTSETYISTLNSFKQFRQGMDLVISETDSDLMQAYEAFLKLNGLTMNTTSFYMRILRAVYNRAVDKEIVKQRYPFKHVYTGVDKTLKRAISLKEMKHIKELNILLYPSLEFARDVFLFSFYTRGMSFVDMAYLRKKDLSNGVLSYRRRKTGGQLQIKWEKCMQDIVGRYENYDTPYLLPIIIDPDRNYRTQYQNSLSKVNRNLKDIAKIIGLPLPLTLYVARHSWASIAKSKAIPISVISEGMGHNSEATTQIYLTLLNTVVLDKANELIIKSL